MLENRSYLKKHSSIAKDKLVYIPNGVDAFGIKNYEIWKLNIVIPDLTIAT